MNIHKNKIHLYIYRLIHRYIYVLLLHMLIEHPDYVARTASRSNPSDKWNILFECAEHVEHSLAHRSRVGIPGVRTNVSFNRIV